MSFAMQNQLKALQAQVEQLKTRVEVLEEAQKSYDARRPVLTLKKPEKTSNGQG